MAHLDLASDASLLESMFAAKENKMNIRSNSVSQNDRGSASDANKLSVLDPKRANNIEIMISFIIQKRMQDFDLVLLIFQNQEASKGDFRCHHDPK